MKRKQVFQFRLYYLPLPETIIILLHGKTGDPEIPNHICKEVHEGKGRNFPELARYPYVHVQENISELLFLFRDVELILSL